MKIDYDLDSCYIKNCNNKSYKHFLCEEHYKEYITDENISQIQEHLYRERVGTLPFRYKIVILLFRVVHSIFYIRLAFAEHFPLESLFLYHYYYQTKRLSNDKEKDDAKNKLVKLKKDFDYAGNTYIPKIEHSLTALDKKLSVNDIETLYLTYLIRNLINVTPKTFLVRFGLSLLATLFIIVAASIKQISIKTVADLNIYYLILGSFVLLGLVYFILKFIYSIDGLIKLAFCKKLFREDADNLSFLSEFQYAKSALASVIEFIKTNRLLIVLFSLGNSFIIVRHYHLNYIEFILSMVINFFFIYSLYRLFLIFPIYTRISPRIWRIPKKNFFINIYSLDKRSNMGPIIDSNNYYILANLSSILFVLFLLIAFPTYKFLYVIFALFTLLRLISLKHSYSLYKNIKNEIRDSVNNEIHNLDKLGFSEKLQKYEFISRLKTYPVLSERLKKILLIIIVNIFLPLLILFLDKDYSIIEKFTVVIREHLLKLR